MLAASAGGGGEPPPAAASCDVSIGAARLRSLVWGLWMPPLHLRSQGKGCVTMMVSTGQARASRASPCTIDAELMAALVQGLRRGVAGGTRGRTPHKSNAKWA